MGKCFKLQHLREALIGAFYIFMYTYIYILGVNEEIYVKKDGDINMANCTGGAHLMCNVCTWLLGLFWDRYTGWYVTYLRVYLKEQRSADRHQTRDVTSKERVVTVTQCQTRLTCKYTRTHLPAHLHSYPPPKL